MKTDVLVVGGGPAGLSAAYEVASRGYRTIIVDESRELGGQLRQQTQVLDTMPHPWAGLRGFQVGESLVERLNTLPVEFLLNHEVIGLYLDGSVGVNNGKEVLKIEPLCIIVATGAAESARPFPGWTLPGIMTIGAAQILINRERVYPGKKALVLGSSDMALEITRQMYDVGIDIAGVVEPEERLGATDNKIIKAFQETEIPVLFQTEIVSATGSGKIEEVHVRSLKDSSRETRQDADFICIDGGRHPILEMLSILDCSFQYQKELGGWVPSYKDTFQTVIERVFVAGQAAGITCLAGIILTAALAGLGAVDYLEKQVSEERESKRKTYWNELREFETMQLPAVWQARMAHIKGCATSI